MAGQVLVFDPRDPSDVVKTYKVRKSHTKSRAGCKNCKQRRVKASETKRVPFSASCRGHEDLWKSLSFTPEAPYCRCRSLPLGADWLDYSATKAIPFAGPAAGGRWNAPTSIALTLLRIAHLVTAHPATLTPQALLLSFVSTRDKPFLRISFGPLFGLGRLRLQFSGTLGHSLHATTF